MKTVAILGLGLMGGSIGKALKARNIPLRIQAFARRKETRDLALSEGIADAVYDRPSAAVKDADLVIMCVPVCSIPDLLLQAKPGLKKGAVITDVGSTKQWLGKTCAELLSGTENLFIGSHPMCGSEKTGLEVADPQLYLGAVCVVCADAETREDVWKVSRFWTRIGAKVVEMPAEKHDQLAATGSHNPHVAATCLALACEACPEELIPLAGPGFRDTTRIAEGSPSVWRDIIKTNSGSIRNSLNCLQSKLSLFLEAMDAEDYAKVEELLDQGARIRKQICAPAPPPRANRVIAIDGPSASGKSTVAKSVAGKLGSLYVDSGAMYRGMTWKVLQSHADPENEQEVIDLLNESCWTFSVQNGAVQFEIDGVNPGEAIRGEAVRENVSYVARIPEVRRFIVEKIRELRSMGSLVVEGRDIGSVIFPESPYKFYLDADPVERARRRNAELEATEGNTSVEAVQESLAKRDHLDSTRKTAPLLITDGARVVDTTHLTLEEVVEQIVAELRMLT